jgi:pantetheine-phosphate adenylyltransferase
MPKAGLMSAFLASCTRMFCNHDVNDAKPYCYAAFLAHCNKNAFTLPLLHDTVAMAHTSKGKREVKRAVYAGSFDPVTNGHLWMIREAVELFDELIVAVGVNPEKHCTFSVDERVDMLRAVTRGFSKLRVDVFENQFLVNYAQSIGANYIIRGIRTASDYEYERTMRYINSTCTRTSPPSSCCRRGNMPRCHPPWSRAWSARVAGKT